tara:strand:- start:26 stop:523 length:498 start_codon:yes stop_codon:yes gene_type:complete
MPINKTYPGPITVSKRMIVNDALTQDGFGTTFGLTQPANSIVEKVYVRVLTAPVIATGCSLGFEAGTDADVDNVVNQSGDDDASDNILDAASDDPGTIDVNAIFDLTATAGGYASAYTANDEANPGIATGFVTEDTELKFRFRLSDHAIATQGKFEVSFVFRVFE